MSGFGRHWALKACAALLAFGLGGASVSADEGQWPPGQVGSLDAVHLKSLGLELGPRRLGLGGAGLFHAVVKLDNCSAALVAPTGLVLTSYGCVEDVLRAAGSSDHDYLESGLLARKQSDELPAPGSTIEVLEDVTDVTRDVLSGAATAHDDAARERAIELASDKQVARCERRHPGRRCRVQRFYLGKEFRLLTLFELRDVRVVYAPPASVGQFGGAVDEGMWPRHAGSFAILRAYVGHDGKPAGYAKDNVPYKPRQWLHLGDQGIAPGDFVATLGYPGRTRRYLPAAELSRYAEQVLPGRVGLYGEWVDALTRQAARSQDIANRIAVHRQQLAERLQAARSLLGAFRRLDLVEQGRRRERRLGAWCSARPDRKRSSDALAVLSQLSTARRARFSRALLLDSVEEGPDLLAVAVDLVRRARARQVPDRQLDSIYSDDSSEKLWRREAPRLARFDAAVDAELMASLVLRARGLAKADRIDALDKLGGGLGDKQRPALVRQLAARIRTSALSSEKHTRQLFDQADAAALDKSRDPLIVVARGLVDAIERLHEERAAERGTESRIAPAYFDMLRSVQGGPVYPDANGTLRMSFGTVAGYRPEDGLRAEPQTTLSGAVEKATGEKPFDLPRRLLQKASSAGESYWADPDLDDLPVCFLMNTDTVAGDPGGPVIDGQGHLVGIDFDRVRDNVASEFAYSADRSRSIAVDIRYMLWVLDRVDDAGQLLRELDASQYRSAPSRRERAAAPRLHGPGLTKTHRGTHPNACGCTVPGGSSDAPPVLLLLTLLGLARARRRRSS